MFMRHLSHGVGHLQYEWQHEKDPKHDTSMGRTLEEDLDLSDDVWVDAGDSDSDELEIAQCNDDVEVAADSDEEEESNEIVDDEEGNASDIIISNLDSDLDLDMNSSPGDCDGYASY